MGMWPEASVCYAAFEYPNLRKHKADWFQSPVSISVEMRRGPVPPLWCHHDRLTLHLLTLVHFVFVDVII